MRNVTDRDDFLFIAKLLIIPCHLTLINSTPDGERDAITVLSHAAYTEASTLARLFVSSRRIDCPRRITMRNRSHPINHSNVRSIPRRRRRCASTDACLGRGIFEHRVYGPTLSCPRTATTTVTTLPPVNQGFYSVNCRALTSVSH